MNGQIRHTNYAGHAVGLVVLVPPHPSGRFSSFPLTEAVLFALFPVPAIVAREVCDTSDSDSEPEEAMYAWSQCLSPKVMSSGT